RQGGQDLEGVADVGGERREVAVVDPDQLRARAGRGLGLGRGVDLHEGGEPERFLDRELERYAPQLTRYAAAFPGETPALALYFPLLKGWRRLPS
ncbi:MAG TPA: hypothetical protein VIU86_07910, partial [Gaiellaceae bacterium]